MSTHQYAMVMDLNKCIGCHTCSIACKKQWTDRDGTGYMYWNNVETQPGQGYPKNWHQVGGGFDAQRNLRPSPLPEMGDYGEALEYDYAQRLFHGKNKPVMPHKVPDYAPNWEEDVGGPDTQNPYFFYLPRICNHCTHPACVEACPRKAVYKRTEDGIVVIDQERCNGYRYCISACPYKKIYFNEVTGKSEKCIFCYPRLEKGQVNACASQCPGRIRFVGLLDDPESPVHQLVLKYKVALGLFPEKGTHPNVYYVPPFNPPKEGKMGTSLLEDPRLPLDYLIYLFGPRVVQVLEFLESELTRVQQGGTSEVLKLLIGHNAGVRFRLVPELTTASAPADVQQQVKQNEPGPALTEMGTQVSPSSGQVPPSSQHSQASAQSQAKGAMPAMAAMAALSPIEAEARRLGECSTPTGCASCSISKNCALG